MGGKKSTLALRIAFEVMVENENLILLKEKKTSIVNLNVWTTSINGGAVALHWKLPQAPCLLLSTVAAMTQSYQIAQHIPGPTSLHPWRGLGSQKHNGFSRGTVTFTVSLADPSSSSGNLSIWGPRCESPWEAVGHWALWLPVPWFSVACAVFRELKPSGCTASFRGGILSLILSKPFASSKLQILCGGENPRIA